MTAYEKLLERYRAGSVPWDAELPPPEVIDCVNRLPPGRALDLGCGFGRAAIYLAQKKWQVDAVDFIPQAVAEGIVRAKKAGVAGQINFHVASVADLAFLVEPYQFALDVGCLHALNEAELITYRDGLLRLLSPGAVYLLFARLQQAGEEVEEGPRGLPEAAIRALFAAGFEFEKVEHGRTQVEDFPAWQSAWFWFHRSG
jgi:cyclopropane fatty-acyl-phospholipid synthase-like methyltransferase